MKIYKKLSILVKGEGITQTKYEFENCWYEINNGYFILSTENKKLDNTHKVFNMNQIISFRTEQ